MTSEHLLHTIPPIYDGNSKILILGSFPSVKSREVSFYYGQSFTTTAYGSG
jgi:double-stranded uracil-DNA glycosylase